jgi:hypothetical protein
MRFEHEHRIKRRPPALATTTAPQRRHQEALTKKFGFVLQR